MQRIDAFDCGTSVNRQTGQVVEGRRCMVRQLARLRDLLSHVQCAECGTELETTILADCIEVGPCPDCTPMGRLGMEE